MRVEIGGRRRYKSAYQPIERTTCAKCEEKDCQGCIIKDIYDTVDEIRKATYWSEYRAGMR